MIRQIEGVISETTEKSIIIRVGDIGYEVFVAPDIVFRISVGDTILLHTALVRRDDGDELFGFPNSQERKLFDLLRSVSGVGPRIALSLIGSLGYPGIMRALGQKDTGLLSSVPGIGKKVAEKLILELRDKVAHEETMSNDTGDIVHALESLGYNRSDIIPLLSDIGTLEGSIDDKIRYALSLLHR
jgi:holliday junction DNA helicase RuvA